MSLVRCKDHRTGTTYVYESESYWDKEKKQPRARRKLIGKIDEATGEIVPTDGRGRKRKDSNTRKSNTTLAASDEKQAIIKQQEELIAKLRSENACLQKEKALILKKLRDITEAFGS